MPIMDRIISDTRFAVVLGVAVAVTAAVYVAFGPPSMESSLTLKGSPRRKGRRRRFSGEPRGLHNAGNTCFVNAVLQATAACPAMILWLEERREELLHQNQENVYITLKSSKVTGDELTHSCPKLDDSKCILQLALLRVLRVANGDAGHTGEDESDEKKAGDPEIWAPASLFRALRAHRWVINTDEQDAHEFLQVLLSTVEEELQKEPKILPSSLFDTSGIEAPIIIDDEMIGEKEKKKNENIASHNTSSLSSPAPEDNQTFDSDIDDNTDQSNDEKIRMGSRSTKRPSHRQRRKPCSRSSSGVFVRSGEELSMESVIKQTRLAAASSTPFTGTLTNKLSFRGTGKCKSPTSSTIFNNITLNLPNSTTEGSLSSTYSWVSGVNAAPVTLETLLQMFVSVEAVSSATSANNPEILASNLSIASNKKCKNGVNIWNGNDQRDLVKQLTFARLPECICLHIQRTAFENGIPRKRNDPVLFPSILNMDNYVYNRQISKKMMLGQLSSTGYSHQTTGACHTPETNAQTPLDVETPSYASSSWLLSPNEDDNSLMSSISSTLPDTSKYSFNNNYDLRAVVVHLGAIDSGHYVTYRREPDLPPSSSESKPRWFYTSDSLVREVTIDEVLNKNPYMLFYEKAPITDRKSPT